MVTFGENGRVLESDAGGTRAYGTARPRKKLRHVALATMLCTVAASITVALLAGITAFIAGLVFSLVGVSPAQIEDGGGFFGGSFIALMVAAFNWFVFYIVLPVTLVVLSLSLGLFPGRGITRPAVYYRWAAIWGAILVGGPTGAIGFSASLEAGAGAALTGLALGAVSGLICARLFLAIVRPARQVGAAAADVF